MRCSGFGGSFTGGHYSSSEGRGWRTAPGEGRILQDGAPHPPLRGTFSPRGGEKDLEITDLSPKRFRAPTPPPVRAASARARRRRWPRRGRRTSTASRRGAGRG